MPKISCTQFREFIVNKSVCSLIYTTNKLLSMRAMKGFVTEVIRRGDSETYYVARALENGNVALMQNRLPQHEILLSRPYGVKRQSHLYLYAGMMVFRLSWYPVDGEQRHTYYIVKEDDDNDKEYDGDDKMV